MSHPTSTDYRRNGSVARAVVVAVRLGWALATAGSVQAQAQHATSKNLTQVEFLLQEFTTAGADVGTYHSIWLSCFTTCWLTDTYVEKCFRIGIGKVERRLYTTDGSEGDTVYVQRDSNLVKLVTVQYSPFREPERRMEIALTLQRKPPDKVWRHVTDVTGFVSQQGEVLALLKPVRGSAKLYPLPCVVGLPGSLEPPQ